MKRLGVSMTFLICLSFTLSAFSQDLYVSPKGSDSNPGSRSAPLASISAASSKARNLRKNSKSSRLVKIMIMPGNHLISSPLIFGPEDSGTPAAPLVIQGMRGAVISGYTRLPGFRQVSESLWKIDLKDLKPFGGDIQHLFVNGKRAILARFPNEGHFLKMANVNENYLNDKTKAQQEIQIPEKQFGLITTALSRGERPIISVYHAWDLTRKYIAGCAGKGNSIYINGKPMQAWNRLDNSAQYFLENSSFFLDAAGEYFLDKPGAALYYFPRSGEKLVSSSAVVPTLSQLMIVGGEQNKPVANIYFRSLSFQFTNNLMNEEGEEPVQAAALSSASIEISYANNVYFENCEIVHTGNSAIWFRKGCQNSGIRDSYLHDLGIGGVKIGETQIPLSPKDATGHLLIDNNIIRSGGKVNPTGVGVFILQSGDNQVSHNDIADFRYSGISVGWVWGYGESPSKRNRILFNHIHHLGWGELSDMGGVYTLGPSEGTVVSNNVIHHIYSYGYGGWGLYTDEGSTGILEENNLVYRCKSSGFHQHYGKNNIIRNNIFALQFVAQLQATRIENHNSFTFAHNIVYFNSGKLAENNWDKVSARIDSNLYWDTRNPSLKISNEPEALVTDPGFVDPLTYDFRFRYRTGTDQIGFKPFDFTQAGVYGSRRWKKLSKFDPNLAREFDRRTNSLSP